ncbi:hypothetical protein H0H93_007092 [Arthromyces matolae]|nr:hypothetical protein H0H93_007092 [Arthromyces matolae]
MPSSVRNAGENSPDLPAMAFAQPQHNGVISPVSHYYDEKAAKISSLIDEELKKESARRRDAARREVKGKLSLRTSYSTSPGKSTLQKQFQLYYASQTIEHERPSWRPVVYFNIMKAVRMTLDELDYELNNQSKEDDNAISEIPIASSSSSKLIPSPPVRNTTDASIYITQREIGELRSKLLPLVALEDTLASELSGGVSVTGGRTGAYVRSGWQALVTTWPLADTRPTPAKNHTSESTVLAAKTLAMTSEAIKALWSHRAVKRLIEAKKLRLEESAPFFLDNIDRIIEPDYIPTNADILNVRLQTLGVMEHTFQINMGGMTYDWKLYDVGGARGQRHAWVPFFDDATAIIFLGKGDNQFGYSKGQTLPNSSNQRLRSGKVPQLPQYLEEDPKTNRIDDSLQLFNSICSNKLLVKAHLVLLLNKADLLRKKVEAGIKVRK